MGHIHRLPSDLANQIAAGEVVERPASAVKELLENSLDALATRCDVEIEGGGITRLSVRDDGRGMDPDDAGLCLERHATSKISSLEQLSNVMSFGFRGEALPSIASVSRFELRTRPAERDTGTEIQIEGGATGAQRPIGMAPGTEINVRDLFYNVPARRKFLRSTGTESGHITEVVEAAALARPEVTFTLTRDGRKSREWLRAQSREQRVRDIFDPEELCSCRGERGPLAVEALLSRPERARSGAGGLKLFVNNRPVRERALLHTVAQAYGSVLERGRYPRGVVYLDLPPTLVDVNVHPQKTEVRFADIRAVTDAVYTLLSRELARAFSLPAPARNPWSRGARGVSAPLASAAWQTATADEHGSASSTQQRPSGEAQRDAESARPRSRESAPPDAANSSHAGATPHDFANQSESPATWLVGDATSETTRTAPLPRSSEHGPTNESWSNLSFVAQLKQTYLICEGTDGLYIIDQHAAAERVTFHRLRSQYQAREVASQALLFPVTADVTETESEIAREHESDFKALGLDLNVRGNGTVTIHSTPRLLHRASPERLFRDLMGEVSRQGRAFSDAVDLSLATMACHGSIRAGDALNTDEAKALLRALDLVDFGGHCPHGRPIVACTTWADLERKVGRR